MTAAGKSVSKSEKHDAHAEGVSRLSEHNPYWTSSLFNEVYLRNDVPRNMPRPDGNEMRWYQVLTSDTQVTGERQQP
jgi:hypothetical protein